MRPVLTKQQYLRQWSQLHGGYDPGRSWVVAGWLRGSYQTARPLARAGVPPDAVTLLGGLFAAAAVWVAVFGGRWVLLAAALIGVSALLDGLDGAVAVLSGRAGPWGGVLDALVDRVAEVAFLLALWVVGAPAWTCVVAGVLAFAQEYARARAGGLGVGDIAVVTINERPTRVAVVGMFLLAAGVYPGSAPAWAAGGAYLGLALALVGLTQLLPALHRHLSG